MTGVSDSFSRLLYFLAALLVAGAFASVWASANWGRPPERRRPWWGVPPITFAVLFCWVALAKARPPLNLLFALGALVIASWWARSLLRGLGSLVATPLGLYLVFIAINVHHELTKPPKPPRAEPPPPPVTLIPCNRPQTGTPLSAEPLDWPGEWSPTSRFWVHGETDFTVWELPAQRAVARLDTPLMRYSDRLPCKLLTGFSADASHYYVWDSVGVHRWSMADFSEVMTIPLPRPAKGSRSGFHDHGPMAMSPGGGEVAYADFTRDFFVRRIESRGSEIGGFETGTAVAAMTYLADGRLVICRRNPVSLDHGEFVVLRDDVVEKVIPLELACGRLVPYGSNKVLVQDSPNYELDLASGAVTKRPRPPGPYTVKGPPSPDGHWAVRYGKFVELE
jgi:hypothetical protein